MAASYGTRLFSPLFWVEFGPFDVSHVFWVCLFVYLMGFVSLFCFLVPCCFFFPLLDAVLMGSVGDGKQSTLGTCRECWGAITGGRNALPRLGSYSLINLLVRNFTVSAAGGGGGWHGHPTEQHAVTSHPITPHPQQCGHSPLSHLPSTPFPSPKATFFLPNPAHLSHGFPRIASYKVRLFSPLKRKPFWAKHLRFDDF